MGVQKYCTHCGAQVFTRRGVPAAELYDEDLYGKSNILRLLDCGSCGEVADKYVEYDGVLVLIDLVLQSTQAYRCAAYVTGQETYKKKPSI